MFFNFGFSEQYDVVIEQYVGNQLVQTKQLSGPKEMLVVQYMRLVNDICNYIHPIKLVMKRPVNVFDENNNPKTIWHEIEFKNWRDD